MHSWYTYFCVPLMELNRQRPDKYRKRGGGGKKLICCPTGIKKKKALPLM